MDRVDLATAPEHQIAVPGHNNPPEPIDDRPYAEKMLDLSAPMRERAEQLVAGLNASRIDSPETAEQVTTLAGLIRDHMTEMETKRRELRDPWIAAAAAVQAAYKPSIDTLASAILSAGAMIQRYREQVAAKEAAERAAAARKAEEARRAAEDAEAAKKAAEKAGDGSSALDAELAALKARDEAARLEQEAQTVRPTEMIRSQVASAGARVERVPVIESLTKCLTFLRTKHQALLLEAVRPLVASLTRAKVKIDGVRIDEQQKTVFRR